MGGPRLEGLDAPRWIASAHIVAFHYYQSMASPVKYLKLGSWWTQFFFILGGFILSYTEMSKPKPKDRMPLVAYLKKRLVTIYPLHVGTTLMCVLFLEERTIFEWCCLPLNLLLLQSVLPVCYKEQCASYLYNGVSWFLSCLLVYWILLRPLCDCFRRKSLRCCMMWLLGCWLWSLVPWILHPHHLTADWSPYAKLIIGNIIQVGPLGYLHVFVAGVAASRAFILIALVDEDTGKQPTEITKKLALVPEKAPAILRYGCCAGYLTWIAVCILLRFLDPSTTGVYWMFHNGGMMPILVLILFGGSIGVDPLVTCVFKTHLFRSLGRISYSQYLLQDPVSIFLAHYIIPGGQGPWGENAVPARFLIAYPCVLLISAYLVESYFVQPYNFWLRHQMQEAEANPEGTCTAKCTALWKKFDVPRVRKDPVAAEIQLEYVARDVTVGSYMRMQMEEESDAEARRNGNLASADSEGGSSTSESEGGC